MDDEIKGEGNSLNYTFRMHDPRVGRFFAIDPLFRDYPHYTPYSFSGNKVIAFVELEGMEEKDFQDMKNDVKAGIELVKSGKLLEGPKQSANDFLKNVKSASDFLEKKINSIEKENKDNLIGNTIGAFKDGYDFFTDSGNGQEKDTHAPDPKRVNITVLKQIAGSQSGMGGKLGSSAAKSLGNAADNLNVAVDELIPAKIKTPKATPVLGCSGCPINAKSTVQMGAERDTFIKPSDKGKLNQMNNKAFQKAQTESDNANLKNSKTI
jgi:hypothetical protein